MQIMSNSDFIIKLFNFALAILIRKYVHPGSSVSGKKCDFGVSERVFEDIQDPCSAFFYLYFVVLRTLKFMLHEMLGIIFVDRRRCAEINQRSWIDAATKMAVRMIFEALYFSSYELFLFCGKDGKFNHQERSCKRI